MIKKLELGRFLWHGLFVSFMAFAVYYLSAQYVWPLIILGGLGLYFFEHSFKQKDNIKKLLREEEVENRTTAVDFVIGFVLVYAFLPYFAPPILLVCAWSDPCARVVGKYMKGRKIYGTDKSYWGSSTCFFVAVAVLCLFFSLGIALVTGLIVTLAEAFDPKNLTKKTWWLQDNGRIQIASAITLYFLI